MSDVVKYGDRGTGVASVQRYLAALGFRIEIDGAFGPETKAVVMSFQSQRGITADGIVGAQTMIEIAKATGEGWKTPFPIVSVAGPTSAQPQAAGATAMPAVLAKAPDAKALLLVAGIAIALFFLTKKKPAARTSFSSSRFRDDPAAEPGDDGDDDEEEEEDEDDEE